MTTALLPDVLWKQLTGSLLVLWAGCWYLARLHAVQCICCFIFIREPHAPVSADAVTRKAKLLLVSSSASVKLTSC